MLKKIEKEIDDLASSGRDPSSINITFFGLTFKANIDDYRESPSIKIIDKFLKTKNKNIHLVEPNLKKSPIKGLCLSSINLGISEGDILVFLVDHDEFRNLEIPQDKIIVDTKGVTNNV